MNSVLYDAKCRGRGWFVGAILISSLLASAVLAATVPPSWEHPPAQQRVGVFWQEHWYEREKHPGHTRRLRINAPEVVLSRFGDRPEARENGLMIIEANEDLFHVTGAELYAELWGGHPGTANKRVTVNGRSTWETPRVGTEDGHCTFSYPVLNLPVSDLVNGANAFQWALDQGATFWGHAMVDQACLRVALTNRHPSLVEQGLAEFRATVDAQPKFEETWEIIELSLDVDPAMKERIASVTFQAWYDGYDDNGNLRRRDWHGFTLDREPVAHLGTVRDGATSWTWNVRMLPAQKNVATRALVRFQEWPGLVYVTAAGGNLVIPDRANAVVHLYEPEDLPPSFWSRAGRAKSCAIELDVDPGRIEAAELYVISWTGGAGEVKDYFTINGHPYPVAEGSGHTRQFNRLPVDPSVLKQGVNTIALLSDTEHHGIEILYPGPALMIRYQ
jgi:hypothetical protein